MLLLKSLREATGKSQKKVAEEMGLDYKRYNHYETGRSEPDIATLNLMAEYFNVPIDYLLGRETNDEWTKAFRAALQEQLAGVDEANAMDGGIDLNFLRDVADGNTPITFQLACNIANDVGLSLDSILDTENEKKEPTPVSEDGLDENDKRLMGLLKDLTPEQKQLLLAQLKAWTEQNK